MEIAFDFKGDPTGGLIINCKSASMLVQFLNEYLSNMHSFMQIGSWNRGAHTTTFFAQS